MSTYNVTSFPPNLRSLLHEPAPRPGYIDTSGNTMQWNNSVQTWRPSSSSSVVSTTTGRVRKPKRVRTAFTSNQMMELEQEYQRSRYLDRSRRLDLAGNLKLNERTIKIWFQNRRMKEKKDKADGIESCDSIQDYNDSVSPINSSHSPVTISDQESDYRLPESVIVPNSSHQQYDPAWNPATIMMNTPQNYYQGSYTLQEGVPNINNMSYPVAPYPYEQYQPPEHLYMNLDGQGYPQSFSQEYAAPIEVPPVVDNFKQPETAADTAASSSTWISSIYPEGYEQLS